MNCEYVVFAVRPGADFEAVPVDNWFDKITCTSEAVKTIERKDSVYPDLNGPISVCEDHVEAVVVHNKLNRLLRKK